MKSCEEHNLCVVVFEYNIGRGRNSSCPLCEAEDRIKALEDEVQELKDNLND